jgi:REP element-mobilizing transposase RayT
MPVYPGRLAHQTPAWVGNGATYHIRISIDLTHALPLTTSEVGTALLESARNYHEHNRWNCRLFLLMPDHLHALLTFPYDKHMGIIIASWKGYHAKHLQIAWQPNFFDYRIRGHHELAAKAANIRRNPVMKNLCTQDVDWPWVISCV